MLVRCPFCHKLVLRWFYPAHEQKHTRLRPDGQMTDHITNAPGSRQEGSLEGVPQAYRHPRCGIVTGMPEDIIRSYLVNPLLYNDQTFCCGCGAYVDSAELTWEETGECVLDYMGLLRAEYLQRVHGISLAEQEQRGVVVTPAAAQAVGQLAREQGLTPPYYLTLSRGTGKEESVYRVGLAASWKPHEEVVIESGEVQVLVPQAQAEQLRGTIVDHNAAGPRRGFRVSRLFAPRS